MGKGMSTARLWENFRCFLFCLLLSGGEGGEGGGGGLSWAGLVSKLHSGFNLQLGQKEKEKEKEKEKLRRYQYEIIYYISTNK